MDENFGPGEKKIYIYIYNEIHSTPRRCQKEKSSHSLEKQVGGEGAN